MIQQRDGTTIFKTARRALKVFELAAPYDIGTCRELMLAFTAACASAT